MERKENLNFDFQLVEKENPKTIISGGANGVDTSAIQAAKILGYPYTGYIPKNFTSNPYGLIQSNEGYSGRDRLNVDISDFLIGVLLSQPLTGRGTTSTIRYAENGEYKFDPITKPQRSFWMYIVGRIPILILWDVDRIENHREAVSLIRKYTHNYKRIMVSGPCESTLPGIQDIVRDLLASAL